MRLTLETVYETPDELLETYVQNEYGNQQPSRQRRKVQRLPELRRLSLITGISIV